MTWFKKVAKRKANQKSLIGVESSGFGATMLGGIHSVFLCVSFGPFRKNLEEDQRPRKSERGRPGGGVVDVRVELRVRPRVTNSLGWAEDPADFVVGAPEAPSLCRNTSSDPRSGAACSDGGQRDRYPGRAPSRRQQDGLL